MERQDYTVKQLAEAKNKAKYEIQRILTQFCHDYQIQDIGVEVQTTKYIMNVDDTDIFLQCEVKIKITL